MDWIRENKVLAGILGVIVAGSLGLGYMLYGAWSSYTASKEQYVGLGNQIAQLKSLPLSPSEKNLADKKALVEEYASGVNKLGGALLVLQDAVLPKPTKDTEFQAKLKEKSIEIKKMASALKVQLPAEFAFGFDPYNNAPPPSEAATELSGYLEAIESIVKLAMGCKVTSIDLLERSQIPEEKGGAADTSSPTKSKGKSAAKAKGTAAAKASAAITEKRQLSMILTLDQGPLQLLMARLANPADMPYFASVRVLRV
ncbi:MAG: Amuc_1100 family pilus-like protein, partial [Verrucomicrobiaceae bacterium]|nr:Amuc_1100 family pilus-like protein [Verrucomicrobiaceae bacterium]